MRGNSLEDGPIVERNEALAAFLEAAGIDRDITRASLEIDATLQRWRRRVNKRELGIAALRALELEEEIDLAQLDVLMATDATGTDFGCESEPETMVSTIAARLRIDPSRASRLVSELIAKGLARRTVSQMDARRTIVELTARGDAIVDAVRRFKFLVMGEFLSGWTPEEIETFIPLFNRFAAWTGDANVVGPDRFPQEFEEIAARLRAIPTP
ncbi:MarR family winged helix-turn-helix transcriptional regulator [Pseudodonghicola flavimaris]|uniref:MarR family winged helix-turn-helix transcriptional regulator n=1 Tax=Pseudodonghicola flavimaris TaxID=3050036 RepID=A0ABT7EXY4_9RHOB|nr:MarR family winged helix-turn-helix transcriptional regulator [Pseudodonghicola flavimaris]MDK3017135.1 MarR family winged helix-turn-helix transcriptional regulator [Pseudodonghicola flavimaris]